METKIYYKKNIIIRKKKLIDNLCENKLEYIKNGICDSYIKFGKPDLPIVIENIEYHGIHGYVNSVLHDLRSLFSHLKEYSQFEANCFK